MAEFSPKNVVTALEPLSNSKAQELFFHLGVPLHMMDNIQEGNMYKVRVAEEWINNNFEASWETLAEGLKKIGMQVLAKRIAAEHNVVRQSSSATAPAAPPSPNPPSTSQTVQRPNPPSTSSQSVSQVAAAVEEFEDTYVDLMSDTRAEMCDRESKDPKFLDKFRDRLSGLSIFKKHLHARFFRESEDEILDAKNVRKIFAILSRHCSFRNYEILLHLVKKFGSDELKQRMSDFCKSLEEFEAATPVDIYAKAISATEQLSQAFSEMATKLNKPTSQCLLCELRKLADSVNPSSPNFMTAYLLPMMAVTDTPGDEEVKGAATAPPTAATAPPTAAPAPVITPRDFVGFPKPELIDLLEVVGVDVLVHWRQIGLGLGVRKPELEAIQQTHRGAVDPEMDCITQVFTRWHDGVTSEYSWRKLAEVLCSPLVKKEGLLKDMHSKLVAITKK